MSSSDLIRGSAQVSRNPRIKSEDDARTRDAKEVIRITLMRFGKNSNEKPTAYCPERFTSR